jgi:hypothetical protein
MNEKQAAKRNQNPHAEATAAMYIWGAEYAAQRGGCMDFWDGLSDSRKGICRDLVARIKLRPSEASL